MLTIPEAATVNALLGGAFGDARPFTFDVYPSREDWTARRNDGIGASEAAVVLGLSKWKTPLALWGEKRGLTPPPDLSDNEAVQWGNRLEAIVADHYASVSGRTVVNLGPTTVLRSTANPFMTCTLDRLIVDDPRGPGVLEVKTAGAHAKHDWDEGVPPYYMPQLQHQLAVTGCQWGSFGVLIGGQEFRWVDVERDEAMIEAITEAERKFWDQVESEDAPAPGATQADADTLKALFPEEQAGVTVELTGEALEWDEQRLAAMATMDEAKAQKTLAENQLKAAIGDAERGVLPDGTSYTFKTTNRKEHVVKASSFRVLRRKKAK